MGIRHVLGFLLTSMTAAHIQKGTYSSLILTELVKDYVTKLNISLGGAIADFGLTAEYRYWTQTQPPPTEPPLSGEEDWIEYNIPVEFLETEEKLCIGIFTWLFQRGVCAPFQIFLNVTVPVEVTGLPPKLIAFDLSNKTNETIVVKWGEKQVIQNQRKHMRVYDFTVKVDFNGYFAYCLSGINSSSQNCTAVSVTALADSSKGLEIDKGKLSYKLNGTFVEQIMCYGERSGNKVYYSE
ncbi:hypothetical protein MTO96_008973 [Rhipicephalus appendiculatus]